MNTDVLCQTCHRRLQRGPSRAKVANVTGLLFMLGMGSLIFVYIPPPGGSVDLAYALTNGLFCGVAAVVGRMVGWVIGAFICD